MTDQIALIVVAAGGLIFTAVGIYAVILQAAWMGRHLEHGNESMPSAPARKGHDD